MLVRDFNNLIGRAGRAGMHTEGSVIFADSKIFDEKAVRPRQWSEVKDLLNVQKSEPCGSTLFTLFDPLVSDDQKHRIELDTFELLTTYLQGQESVQGLIRDYASEFADKKFSISGLEEQIQYKANIISAIESFLMAYWDEFELEGNTEKVTELAQGTFAYFLADDAQEANIIQLFLELAKNVGTRIADPSKKILFAKTLFGVQTSLFIEDWVDKNKEQIISSENNLQLITTIWPLLSEVITNRSLKRCDDKDALFEMTNLWINGHSYSEMHEQVVRSGAKLKAGSQKRELHVEHIVDMCDNGLAFEGALVVGAVAELVGMLEENADSLVLRLLQLQKNLSYGLPDMVSISICELGIFDRVISMELKEIIGEVDLEPAVIKESLQKRAVEVQELLSIYPTYFTTIFETL